MQPYFKRKKEREERREVREEGGGREQGEKSRRKEHVWYSCNFFPNIFHQKTIQMQMQSLWSWREIYFGKWLRRDYFVLTLRGPSFLIFPTKLRKAMDRSLE